MGVEYVFSGLRAVTGIATIVAGAERTGKLMSWFLWPLFLYFMIVWFECVGTNATNKWYKVGEWVMWAFAVVLVFAGDHWQDPNGVCRTLSLLVIVAYALPVLHIQLRARLASKTRWQYFTAVLSAAAFVFAVVLAAWDLRNSTTFIVFGSVLVISSVAEMCLHHKTPWNPPALTAQVHPWLVYAVQAYALLLLAGGYRWQQAPGACRVLAVLVLVTFPPQNVRNKIIPTPPNDQVTLAPTQVYPAAPPASLKYAVTL